MRSLGLAKEARDLIGAAEQLDPAALDWATCSLLAYLYANVPGWPIGFGDVDEADAYWRKAIELNPTGAEPRRDYGAFLLDEREYEDAVRELEFALAAPLRVDEVEPEPGISCHAYRCERYTDASDAEFRTRIRELLDEARKKLE